MIMSDSGSVSDIDKLSGLERRRINFISYLFKDTNL